ncbi:efflux RND transporter periplasmic adaptor subunit [Myxococcota bacterium]|nr:efflux RND transporter periplasmic adaptor subunit [Myxococcota bacterium]
MTSQPLPPRRQAPRVAQTGPAGPTALKPDARNANSAETGRRAARWLLPLAVLGLGAVATAGLYATRPVAEKKTFIAPLPLVEVFPAMPQTLALTVESQGTVVPTTESDLVAEVKGRVTWVSEALVAGGFFRQGQELLRLDGRDYTIALERAWANLELRASEAQLATSEAERRRALALSGAASDADLDQFENRARVARAALDEARASRDQAKLDLERTLVSAPYDGRVRDRLVDLGQFVSPGTPLARIHATDRVEVRLPIPTQELAHLDLPFGLSEGDASLFREHPVRLSARYAGQEYQWPAVLVRSEGEIEERTRMLNVVAEVANPYATDGPTGRPPLAPGMFVHAEIQGRNLPGVYALPRAALRDESRVVVADAEDRLRYRDVGVIRRNRHQVLVGAGLQPGERVVVSPLKIVTDGMQVRVLEFETP